MAKSILHAVVGILADRGRLDLTGPAAVAEWAAADDPRGAITLDHLLHMRSGLAWLEDYVDRERSTVIEMLFGAGRPDVAATPRRGRWPSRSAPRSPTRAARPT